MRLTGPRRVHTICRAEEQGLVRWAATSVRLTTCTFGNRSTKGGRRIYVVPSPDGICVVVDLDEQWNHRYQDCFIFPNWAFRGQ